MQVSYDLAAQATYVRVSREPVARTVEISDLVMVDLDAHDQPVGVEFLAVPARISPAMVDAVVDRFPIFKVLRDPETWVEPGTPGCLAHA